MSGHTCSPINFIAPKKICGALQSFSHFFHENKTAIFCYPNFKGIDELLILPHLLNGWSYPDSIDELPRFPSRSIDCFCLRYEFYFARSLGLCSAKFKCLLTLRYDDDRLLLIPPRLSSISAQRNRAYGQVILSLFNNERRQVDGIASGGAQLS
jgi:hypothetical protein